MYTLLCNDQHAFPTQPDRPTPFPSRECARGPWKSKPSPSVPSHQPDSPSRTASSPSTSQSRHLPPSAPHRPGPGAGPHHAAPSSSRSLQPTSLLPRCPVPIHDTRRDLLKAQASAGLSPALAPRGCCTREGPRVAEHPAHRAPPLIPQTACTAPTPALLAGSRPPPCLRAFAPAVPTAPPGLPVSGSFSSVGPTSNSTCYELRLTDIEPLSQPAYSRFNPQLSEMVASLIWLLPLLTACYGWCVCLFMSRFSSPHENVSSVRASSSLLGT